MNTISFPGLGNFEITMDRIAISFFGINIHWYGIIIATGFLLAVVLALKTAKKYDIDPDKIIDLVLVAAPISIITARLYYVVLNLGYYLERPSEIIMIWRGGLAIYGGLIGALITTFIFCKVNKINPFKLIDFGIPYFILAQAIGRWGNFVNQEAFGSNTSLPWGMTGNLIRQELEKLKNSNFMVDPSLPVHPTFLYESLWNLGAFLILIWYRKRKKLDGEVFFLYMILYGIGRAWIEGLRMDSLMLGSLRFSQVLAIVFAVACSIAFVVLRKKRAAQVLANQEDEPSKYSAVLQKMKEIDESAVNKNDSI